MNEREVRGGKDGLAQKVQFSGITTAEVALDMAVRSQSSASPPASVRLLLAALLSLAVTVATATASSAHHVAGHIGGPTTAQAPTAAAPQTGTTAVSPVTTAAPSGAVTASPVGTVGTASPTTGTRAVTTAGATTTRRTTRASTTIPRFGGSTSSQAAPRPVPVAPATGTEPVEEAVVGPTTETTEAAEPASPGGTLTIGSRPLRLDRVDPATGGDGGMGMPFAVLLVAALVAGVAALALANHFGWLALPLLAPSRWRPATAAGAAAPIPQPPGDDVLAGTTAGAVAVDPRTERMAARLVALLALTQRAQFERQGRPLPTTWDAVVDWVSAAGAGPGLEAHEQEILRRPTGALDDAEVAMASWQVEGAVVVTWALGLLDRLPPTDEPVDPVLISGAVGFPDGARTLEVLGSARPRAREEIDAEVVRHERVLWSLQERSGAGRLTEAEGSEAVDVSLAITTQRLRALYWLQDTAGRPAVGIGG